MLCVNCLYTIVATPVKLFLPQTAQCLVLDLFNLTVQICVSKWLFNFHTCWRLIWPIIFITHDFIVILGMTVIVIMGMTFQAFETGTQHTSHVFILNSRMIVHAVMYSSACCVHVCVRVHTVCACILCICAWNRN